MHQPLFGVPPSVPEHRVLRQQGKTVLTLNANRAFEMAHHCRAVLCHKGLRLSIASSPLQHAPERQAHISLCRITLSMH